MSLENLELDGRGPIYLQIVRFVRRGVVAGTIQDGEEMPSRRAVSALLGRVWVNYVRPWLEKRDLTDAAEIVVDAVEALLGRYCGEDKWKLALEKMEARGFNIDNEVVLDALRAAWCQLDLKQLAAGEKEKPPES